MDLNKKSSKVKEKDELCGQKDIIDADNKESIQNTQVIGSALQVNVFKFIFYFSIIRIIIK